MNYRFGILVFLIFLFFHILFTPRAKFDYTQHIHLLRIPSTPTSFTFYLDEIPNEELCLYTSEIYQVLAYHPARVDSIHKANVVFAMQSNENGYRHGTCNYNYALTSTTACERIALSIKQRFNDTAIPPHLVFYASDFIDPRDPNCAHVVNLPYMFITERVWPSNDLRVDSHNVAHMSKSFDISKDIILPPPDTTVFEPCYSRTTFKRGSDKYWIAFKGSIDHGYARKEVLKRIKPLFSKDIVFEDYASSEHKYNDLMLNTTFLLHVDGDLPWSYRFTEILKSGAIPVMIDHEYVVFPFSQLIDWDLALVRIPLQDVGSIDKILSTYDDETLRMKYEYLEYIVRTYLIDRKTQMEWLLFLLEQKYS